MLKVVDLAQEARRPVLTYSLGMRQRLGVALALLGQPRLLVLDEPTNGLDPVGIQDMREMIRNLSRETGVSIFLSSHLLAEIEQIAEDLVVIHNGRMRFQGPMAQLGTAGQAELMVRVGQPGRARLALDQQGFTSCEKEGHIWIQAPESESPRVAACLIEAGCDLFELVPHKANLEARFLALLEEA